MTDDRVVVHRFEPYADHLAFVISDAEATEGVFDGETWDKPMTPGASPWNVTASW